MFKKALLALALLTGLPLFGQAHIGTLPDNGPNLPSTCNVGQIYFLTTGSIGLKTCTAQNTWTTAGGTALGVASADATTPSPGAPTISVHGTPGTTSCSYRTAILGTAGFTLSPLSNTLANCPNTLGASNYIVVTTPVVTGATTCYIFRDTSSTGNYVSTIGLGMIQNAGQTNFDSVTCGQAYNDQGNTAFGATGNGYIGSFYQAVGTGLYSPGFTTQTSDFGTANENFGFGSSTDPATGGNTAIGNASTAATGSATALGANALAQGNSSTAVGAAAVTRTNNSVIVGSGTNFSGTNIDFTGVGTDQTFTATDGLTPSAAVGYGLTVGFGDDFILGYNVTPSAAHQILLGSATSTDAYLGGPSGANVTLHGVPVRTCTNQVFTATSATLAPTCTTVTSAYVDTSIAKTGTDINTSNQVTATHLAAALPVAQGGTGQTFTAGYLASAMTPQSSASCTPITNMTWNIAASKNYSLECQIKITLAASATIAFCVGGPGTPTSVSVWDEGALGASSAWIQDSSLAQSTYGNKTTASSANANTSMVHVHANIQNGSTASGTALTLQTAANGTNNITVGADSTCFLTQTN